MTVSQDITAYRQAGVALRRIAARGGSNAVTGNAVARHLATQKRTTESLRAACRIDVVWLMVYESWLAERIAADRSGTGRPEVARRLAVTRSTIRVAIRAAVAQDAGR